MSYALSPFNFYYSGCTSSLKNTLKISGRQKHGHFGNNTLTNVPLFKRVYCLKLLQRLLNKFPSYSVLPKSFAGWLYLGNLVTFPQY